MIVITLPYPPSVNGYWRNVTIGGKGRTLISEKGRKYRQAVAAAWAASGEKKTLGRLRVEITAIPPDKRSRDLDNILKSLLDSLTHCAAWDDDSQIDDLRIVREPSEKGGSVVVCISRI